MLLTRFINISFYLLLLICLSVFSESLYSQGREGDSAEVRQLIQQAGNANSEQKRYRLLKKLAGREALPPKLRVELETLLPVARAWSRDAKTGEPSTPSGMWTNAYLCGFFAKEARNLSETAVKPGNDWPGAMRPDSPLYSLRAYYRGRALLWIPIEFGGIRHDPQKRENWYSEARALLEIAGKAFPENEVIRMYLGDPPAWSTDFEADPDAPRWANLQREGLAKLTELIHWWIEHRQLENGEFGGGHDDDVEMWRWWAPVLLGFRDPVVVQAQARLSRTVLRQPHMRAGFTSFMTDVEHAAELTTDTITPMMMTRPEEAEWRKRALRLVELARKNWMGVNERGQLQFKSAYFTATEVDTTGDAASDPPAGPGLASDTPWHTWAIEPALVHWLRTGDETVGDLVMRWMDTWVEATARAERGKPPGITPPAIHWPDGRVGGVGEHWYNPEILNRAGSYYIWPSNLEALTMVLLLTYHMTEKEKYLDPIRSMAEIQRKYMKNPPEGEPEPGSAAWAAKEAGMASFLPEVLAKYRVLTGREKYDELIAAISGGYIKMRLGKSREDLIADLERNAKAFRINRPAYTREMRWTDRVLTFNSRWYEQGNGWEAPTPLPMVLYQSVTGDPGEPKIFPMNAVRWLIKPRNFAALVTDSGGDRLEAELYNFRDKPRDVSAELYLLSKGKYTLRLHGDAGEIFQRNTIEVTDVRTRIEITLPSHTPCRLVVSR